MLKYNKKCEGLWDMKKKGYFTEFYLNIDKQARAMYESLCVNKNGEYVTAEVPVASDEYRDETARLFREYSAENNSSISLVEYFGKGQKVWGKEREYVCRAFNRYLSDEMNLSDDEIKGFFVGKTIPQVNREYYEHFRTFFIKQKLLTLGDNLSREQIENRIRRSKLELSKLDTSGVFMPEFRRECEGNIEAYQTALEYMQYAGIGRVDLFSLFNANSLTVYVPQGQTLNPKDKLVEVFSIDKSFKLEDDVVSRDK